MLSAGGNIKKRPNSSISFDSLSDIEDRSAFITPSQSVENRKKRKRLTVDFAALNDSVLSTRIEFARDGNDDSFFRDGDTPNDWGDCSFLSNLPEEKIEKLGINVQHDDDSPTFDVAGFSVKDHVGNIVPLFAKLIVGKCKLINWLISKAVFLLLDYQSDNFFYNNLMI